MKTVGLMVLLLSVLKVSALVTVDAGGFLTIIPISETRVLILNHINGKCVLLGENASLTTVARLGPTSYFFSVTNDTFLAATSSGLLRVEIDTGLIHNHLNAVFSSLYGVTNIGNLLLLGHKEGELSLFDVESRVFLWERMHRKSRFFLANEDEIYLLETTDQSKRKINYRLKCLDTRTGRERWSQSLSVRNYGTAELGVTGAIVRSELLIGDRDSIRKFNRKDGQLIASFSFPNNTGVRFTRASDGELVLVGPDVSLVSTDASILEGASLFLLRQNVLTKIQDFDHIANSIITIGNRLLYCRDAVVECYSTAEMQRLWAVPGRFRLVWGSDVFVMERRSSGYLLKRVNLTSGLENECVSFTTREITEKP